MEKGEGKLEKRGRNELHDKALLSQIFVVSNEPNNGAIRSRRLILEIQSPPKGASSGVYWGSKTPHTSFGVRGT